MDLWRRNRVRPDVPGVELRDVRERLSLFVEAAVAVTAPIRAAFAPPARTLLSRMFGGAERRARSEAVPGTDGAAIHLPARLNGAIDEALDVYRVAALQQAVRIRRGTADVFPWRAPAIVQDLYLASEAAAVDAMLAQALPGFARALRRARAVALRSRADAHRDEAGAVESLYRTYLSGGTFPQRDARTARRSLAWAQAQAQALAGSGRYRALLPDVFLGAVLRADAAPSGSCAAADADASARPAITRPMTRRPRARRAQDDEDDDGAGLWMIQPSAPNEHVEDAMGLQRPVDKQPDADLAGTAESIADLEALRLVSTPGSTREILTADDESIVRAAAAVPPAPSQAGRLAYPEWDYTVGAYNERAAVVRVIDAHQGPDAWVDGTIRRHRPTLARVRRRFEALRARRSVQHAQPEGDDLDLNAFVGSHADRRARLPRNERVYLTSRPARRDFAVLLLIDVSASTESWCGGAHRIIDLEKEALVIVAAALDALRVPFAIQAFSGCGPGDVRVRDVKRFDERYGRDIGRRIGALEPDEYTRTGAALRHAAATFMRQPAYRRLMLLVSDGKPNDCDRYEGRYGVEDARQALAEARLQRIAPYCVTVERHASRHLAPLFGAGNYTVVSAPEQLSAALLDWLRTVSVALA